MGLQIFCEKTHSIIPHSWLYHVKPTVRNGIENNIETEKYTKVWLLFDMP